MNSWNTIFSKCVLKPQRFVFIQNKKYSSKIKVIKNVLSAVVKVKTITMNDIFCSNANNAYQTFFSQQVVKGQPLFVVIAMKMEYVVRSTRDGVVASLASVKPGDAVGKGAEVVLLEPEN